MSGRIPYGYGLRETDIEHVRTSMYEEIPEESEQLKLIYSMYAHTDRQAIVDTLIKVIRIAGGNIEITWNI